MTQNKTIFFSLFFMAITSWAQPVKKNASLKTSSARYTPKQIFNQNTVYLEFLGRSFVYGLGYQRHFSEEVSAGFSFSYISASFGSGLVETKVKAYSIPLFVNYNVYSIRRHQFLVTAGLNLFTFEAKANLNRQLQSDVQKQLDQLSDENNDISEYLDSTSIQLPDLNIDGSGTLAFPQVGIGYQYSAQNGFYGHSNIYATYLIDKVQPWLGFSFGVQF